MLNVVQIGSIGHYAYALPTAKKYGVNFSGIAFPDAADNRERTMKHLSKFGFAPRIYEDWERMLESEKPDIAIVNTVMYQNGEIARKALSMGISVFCEKPVSTTLSGLDALERAYAEVRSRFSDREISFVGMFGIDYLPHFETAYRFVRAGGIGDVRLANAQKSYRMGNRESFYSDREQYGGTIPWVAIHAIEWIERIGGLRPVSVMAYGSTSCNAGNGTMEASTICVFGCEGGRMASVSADVMRPSAAPTHDDDRLRLVGSEGILEVRGGRVFVVDQNGERELDLVQSETELFEELILELQGKGRCRVSAEDTFFATRTALLARESEDTGKMMEID